jgi:hypothetical protein
MNKKHRAEALEAPSTSASLQKNSRITRGVSTHLTISHSMRAL